MGPSDVGLESGRTQTRREYLLSSLDGGIPAVNGLLFIQTPSICQAVPTHYSDLGSAKLTLCAMDGAVEPPWMGSRRVSVRHLVDVAEILNRQLGQSLFIGAISRSCGADCEAWMRQRESLRQRALTYGGFQGCTKQGQLAWAVVCYVVDDRGVKHSALS